MPRMPMLHEKMPSLSNQLSSIGLRRSAARQKTAIHQRPLSVPLSPLVCRLPPSLPPPPPSPAESWYSLGLTDGMLSFDASSLGKGLMGTEEEADGGSWAPGNAPSSPSRSLLQFTRRIPQISSRAS